MDDEDEERARDDLHLYMPVKLTRKPSVKVTQPGGGCCVLECYVRMPDDPGDGIDGMRTIVDASREEEEQVHLIRGLANVRWVPKGR